MLWNSGGGVTAKTCSAGDFFTAVDGSGNFTCSTASGSGDVTAVGDCASGACFDGTSGNSIQFEGSTADAFETTLTVTDPTADRTVTLPNLTGTVAIERVYDVRAYGAKCDDSTDDTAAIQAAIDAAEATGQGGVVQFPVGICIHTALTMDEPGVILRGMGASTSNNGTRLSCNITTGTCITMQSSCTYCGVENLGIGARGTPTDLVLIDGTSASNDHVSNLILGTQGYCTGIKNVLRNDNVDLFGPIAGASCRGISVVDDAVYLNRITGNWSTDIEGMIVIEQTSTNITDTVVISDTEIAQSGGAGAGLKIIGASTTNPPRWVEVSNSLFEAKTTGASAGDYPIYIDNVKEFKCTNCYAHGGFYAVRIDGGPGPIRFVNSEIGDARRDALYHDADVPTELIGTTVSDGSQETTNTYSGIHLTTNSRQFTMIGGRASDDLFFSGSGQKYGILIDAGADEYRFDNVGCEGNDTACASGLSPAAAQAAFTDAVALADSDWSNYVTLRASSLAGNYSLTLPTTDGATNDLLYNTDGSGTLGWRTPNAGTDITADLEEETHASEHSAGGADAITVTNLASACTDAQVLGGNAGGTGVECQTDDDVPEAADYSNLTAGTGITNSPTGTINATLGTAIDTSEITDGTIAFADVNSTQTLAGNPANGASSVWFGTTGLIWEGATSNSNEGLLVAADVGGDRTWTLPDASGTIAVSASTPLTLNATTGNLTIADAAADSSTKGAVTFPSTHFTCTSGTCSLLASPTFGAASGTSYTWTWDLSSGTDPSLIFSTGAVALGSSTGLYGSTSSSGDLNLFSTTHATKGQITLDDQVDIWPSIPDATAASRAIDFSSDYAVSGVAVIHSLMNSRPTVHVGAASGLLGGFAVVSSSGMVIAHDNATATPSGVLLFYADHTIRTTVAAAAPESVSFYDHITVQGSGSITVPSSSGHRSFYANPIISAVDSATATYSAVTMYDALPRVGTDNGASTDGTAVTVTTLKGFNYADVSIDGGTGTETVATQVGVDIGALANGGTNIGLRNASTSVFTPTTQAIAAATDTITCNTTFKKFTTFTGTNALTSNPSIADGQTGQICILENVDATGTDCITLTDSTKGMQLSGNFTLCPNDTIILIYDGTDWIELSEMDN